MEGFTPLDWATAFALLLAGSLYLNWRQLKARNKRRPARRAFIQVGPTTRPAAAKRVPVPRQKLTEKEWMQLAEAVSARTTADDPVQRATLERAMSKVVQQLR